MASIAKTSALLGLPPLDQLQNHALWPWWMAPETGLLARLQEAWRRAGVHPARCVVLLPYAQLRPLAQRLWSLHQPLGFMPRFESTMSWAASLGGAPDAPPQWSGQVAQDWLSAQQLLAQAGQGARAQALTPALLEAAQQLAGVARAQPPQERAAWVARTRAALGPLDSAGVGAWEMLLTHIALEWLGTSSFATDVLFGPAPWQQVDGVLQLGGLEEDALAEALQAHAGSERWQTVALELPEAEGTHPQWWGHRCHSAFDEAQRAAACAVRHVQAGRFPLALVCTDRALARQVQAQLDGAGVAVRDETGWKLSTTAASAALLSLLRAAAAQASSDAVLQWVAVCDPIGRPERIAAEAAVRRAGVRQWDGALRVLESHPQEAVRAWGQQVQAQRAMLQGRHHCAQWLLRVRQALQACGLWQRLQAPGASPAQEGSACWPEGPSVVQALCLHEDAAWPAQDDRTRRWALHDFQAWVQQVLESSSWRPPYPQHEHVVLLPLSQLAARPFAAVVLAGCDEQRLSATPVIAGWWSRAQRQILGLPTPQDRAASLARAWAWAQRNPWGEVLWRSHDDGGEPLLPSSLVQAQELPDAPHSVLQTRRVAATPVHAPLPAAPQWLPTQWSASAYDDLRTCPYRFFALRMLRLQSQDELDADLDKRDFGTWLHAVLRQFHAEDVPLNADAVRAALDAAAQQQRQALLGEDPEFLPFEAAWPAVRDAYVPWWLEHARAGHRVVATEQWREQPWEGGRLVGQLDRIDRSADGGTWVLDYKTESLERTRARVQDALEDTQMAFYGALVAEKGCEEEGDRSLRGAYLNLSEGSCKLVEHRALPEAVLALRTALAHDWQRLHAGAALPALGDGAACDYCAARGLCRKDFWSAP